MRTESQGFVWLFAPGSRKLLKKKDFTKRSDNKGEFKMKARALICDEQQNFSMQDVELKDSGADQIAIKTVHSGVSIGTEFALIRNKISWGPYPLCTGYMGAGNCRGSGGLISITLKSATKYNFRGNDNMALAGGRNCFHV